MTARPAQQVDPDAARDAARDILSDRRFRSEPAPRPLRGPLDWIGDRLQPVVDWIGRRAGVRAGLVVARRSRSRSVAGHRRAHRRGRRTAGASRRGAARRRRRATRRRAEDPDALERAADEAERDGDLERALRLRFRAGSAAARRSRRDRVPAVGDDRRGAARARLGDVRRAGAARSKQSRTAGRPPHRPTSTPPGASGRTCSRRRDAEVTHDVARRARVDRRRESSSAASSCSTCSRRASTARSAATNPAACAARRTRPAPTGSPRTRRCSRTTATRCRSAARRRSPTIRRPRRDGRRARPDGAHRRRREHAARVRRPTAAGS